MTSTGDRRLSFVTALEDEKEETISGPITTQEEENKIAIRPPLKKKKIRNERNREHSGKNRNGENIEK